MSRPTDYPDWATATNYAAGPYSGNANKATPSAGVIAEGFDPSAGIPAEWLNDRFNRISTWLRWLLTLPTTSSDTAQYQYQDAGGNVRSFVDHSGYRRGRFTTFEENWAWEAFTTGAVTNTMLPSSTFSKWVINGTANSSWTTAQPSNTYIPTSTFSNLTLTTPVNSNYIRTQFGSNAQTGLILPQAYSSIVADFELVGGITGTNTVISAKAALSSNGTGTPGTGTDIGIGKRATDTTWQFYVSNAGTPTFVDSGVSCVDGSLHSFTFELHGASSPYGAAKARFFVDGGAVATITTNLPPTNGTQLLGPVFSSDCSGSGCTAANFALGPIRVMWNRSLSSTTV